MQGDIDQVLIARDDIAQRIKSLAAEIIDDTSLATSPPAALTIIPILTGSIIFLADLIRQLPVHMQLHLVSVASYPGPATRSQGATLDEGLTKLPESLAGQHVLIVDDILDSGNTLRLASDLVRARNPASVRTCVLLRKQRPEALAFPVDFVAFDIPDRFVVGYGLDYDDYYRNLPDIVTLRSSVVRQEAGDAPTA